MPDNLLRLCARVLLAILFVFSGFGKLADPAGVSGLLESLHLPVPLALSYLAGICEIAGAVAIVAGFRVRPVGLLLAIWCIATALVVHLQTPFDLMKSLGLAGGFLLLAADGAGKLAMARRQEPAKS